MILVTGATGFLGQRVCRLLESRGLEFTQSSLSLGCDLRDWEATQTEFRKIRPEYVLNCAAYVGGIQFGYKHPVELFQNNLPMTMNLLRACHEFNVKRLVNPISNCAYPAKARLFREAEIWDGPLHESVLVYGFVRKAAWVGSWAYQKQFGLDCINLVLSNMYGPQDHFHAERSHALGALIMKFVTAQMKQEEHVVVWGSGKPVREWLYVDDGAEAIVRAISLKPYGDFINIGVGEGISIADLAQLVALKVGYQGQIVFDPSRPDGAPYKTVDGSCGENLMGWRPQMPLERGIEITIEWYKKHVAH